MKPFFTVELLKWHAGNKRDLPWKKTNDPYKIWISEVVLQQTRIEQGTPYYLNLIELFPDVISLAQTDEDTLMRAWQGLGYYSRARNMLAAANQILNEFGGKFPSEFNDILKLKGVGQYTASAIASFAFNKPYAVVDGNVYRILSRAFGIRNDINSAKGKVKFVELAAELLDKKHSALYNQAIMDFGATVCSPANPACSKCFFKSSCYAYRKGLVNRLPVKSKKIKMKSRWFNFFVIVINNQLIIEKRISNDIWRGLYQFPLIETECSSNPLTVSKFFAKRYMKHGAFKISGVTSLPSHKLTHQKIFTQFIGLKTGIRNLKPHTEWLYVNSENLKKFAFPKVIEVYLEKLLY